MNRTPPRRFKMSTQTILENIAKGWAIDSEEFRRSRLTGNARKKSFFNVKNNRL